MLVKSFPQGVFKLNSSSSIFTLIAFLPMLAFTFKQYKLEIKTIPTTHGLYTKI